MTPVKGDRVVQSDSGTIARILATIRAMESGNYTALNKTASASGAYQIIDSTWKGWSSQSGVSGATAYPRAYQAPPAIQDAVAGWKVRAVLAAYGNHLAAIPVNWYSPAAWGNDSLMDKIPRPDAGNKLTVRQYAEHWITKYDAVSKVVGPDGTFNPFPNAGGIGDVTIPGIIGGAKDAIMGPINSVEDFISLITTGSTWVRVAQVLGGAIMIGMGVWIVTHDQPLAAAGNLVGKGATTAALV